MLKQSQESNDKDYHCFIERAQVSHMYISSLYYSFSTEKKKQTMEFQVLKSHGMSPSVFSELMREKVYNYPTPGKGNIFLL